MLSPTLQECRRTLLYGTLLRPKELDPCATLGQRPGVVSVTKPVHALGRDLRGTAEHAVILITVIDTATDALLTAIATEDAPLAVPVTQDSFRAYVTNSTLSTRPVIGANWSRSRQPRGRHQPQERRR